MNSLPQHSGLLTRVWNAYQAEVTKALRRKFTYMGPILVTLAVIIVAIVRKLNDHQEASRDSFITYATPSGYSFIAYATPMALNLLGLLLLLMYCAGLISSELGGGSIRMVLVRPVRRHEFVLAKVLLAMSYATAMTLCVATTSWLTALWLGPLNGIEIGEEALYSSTDMALAYLYGALLILLPQFAAGAYAIMISAFTRSTGAATGGVVGLWILADVLKYPLRVDRFLFSTYLETPWRVFIGRCNGLAPTWFPDVLYCIITSIVFFILFTTVAAVALSRRDLRV